MKTSVVVMTMMMMTIIADCPVELLLLSSLGSSFYYFSNSPACSVGVNVIIKLRTERSGGRCVCPAKGDITGKKILACRTGRLAGRERNEL